MRWSRRQGMGSLLAGAVWWAAPARAQAPPANLNWAQLYEPITGGRTPEQGRVSVVTPRLADNGLSVPLLVRVDSPMNEDHHVQRMVLLSNRNPRPVIAEFELGPWSGKAEVATRVRLNGSQEVMALVQTSDGLWWRGTAEVEVTESACLDAS
ncbi:MAG: sulfur oxidation protein SoxY [Betaproteobacteria bacterium]|nr:sulfur oxidation protein SoxY [Betaproteobacteria bacterium]